MTPKALYALGHAIDELYPLVMEWLHRPVSKNELLDAWRSLPADSKKALDEDVRAAVLRAHGSEEFVAWRYKGLTAGKLGGSSLTTNEPRYLDPSKYQAYLVRADEVLLHWAQPEFPLGGRAFGHEKELILKPDVTEERRPAP